MSKLNIKTRLQRTFLAGLLVIVPISLTVFILFFIFRWLDNLLHPLIIKLFALVNIEPPALLFPGVGIVALVLLIFFIGITARNFIGRKVLLFGERILERIPVVRSLYNSIKQIMEAITLSSHAFKRVVLIEYPRKGLYSIAFETSKSTGKVNQEISSDLVSVFVPTTPNPTSGYLLLVPVEDVIYLKMSVEEGVKFILSGGILFKDIEHALLDK